MRSRKTNPATTILNIWATMVLLAAENALVAANLVRRLDSEVKGKGQSLIIPTLVNISATAKSANTDVVATSNTETSVTINISNQYYAAVKIEDIASVQASYDLRSLYAEKIGLNLNVVPLRSDSYRTFRKFGGTPRNRTIPSQALYREGVETRDGTSYYLG